MKLSNMGPYFLQCKVLKKNTTLQNAFSRNVKVFIATDLFITTVSF